MVAGEDVGEAYGTFIQELGLEVFCRIPGDLVFLEPGNQCGFGDCECNLIFSHLYDRYCAGCEDRSIRVCFHSNSCCLGRWSAACLMSNACFTAAKRNTARLVLVDEPG